MTDAGNKSDLLIKHCPVIKTTRKKHILVGLLFPALSLSCQMHQIPAFGRARA